MQLIPPEQIDYFRSNPSAFFVACRKIPILFVSYVCNVKPARLQFELQDFLSRTSDGTVIVPRGHSKSVNLIARCAWEIGNNPNIRINYVMDAIPNAQKSVTMARRLIESDEFHNVFPEIEFDDKNWGRMAFTVKRKAKHRDPTMSAHPILGKAAQRSDLLIFDDVENMENSIRQPQMRQQVKDAYTNTWLPTLVGAQSRVWRAATPWAVDGVSMDWKRQYEEEGSPELFFRQCDGTRRSPWPEEFPPEELEKRKKRMGAIAYARAYEMVPMSTDEVVFKEDDLLSAIVPVPPGRTFTRVAATDMAFTSEAAGLKGKKSEADYSVLQVADNDDLGHAWVRRVMRRRCSYPEWKRVSIEEMARLGVQVLKGEASGPIKGIWQDYTMEARKRIPGLTIKTAKRGNKDKYARAIEVQPVVESKRYHIAGTPEGQPTREMLPLLEEMCAFPVGAHDDLVDTAIDIMDELCKPRGEETLQVFDREDTWDGIVKLSDRKPSWEDVYRMGGGAAEPVEELVWRM